MRKWKKLLTAAMAAMVFTTAVVPGMEAEAASKPKATKITSCNSPSAGKVTVRYKKVKGCNYQVQAATNSKMTQNKKTIKTSSTANTLTLKEGKTYYVRVRTYKKTGKKTKYSKWSSKQKITVRKGKKAPKHVHKYNIPVKKEVEVVTPVPLSEAKYPEGEYNKGTSDYRWVEYVVYDKDGFEKPILEHIKKWGHATNSTMIKKEFRCEDLGVGYACPANRETLLSILANDQAWVDSGFYCLGWAEMVYSGTLICAHCGLCRDESDHQCPDGTWNMNYINDISLVDIIVHPTKFEKKTVTEYKCSCGAVKK